jgi:peptidoglycan hydrolase CwlO-like protein
MLSDEKCEQNANIATSVIEEDIRDTQEEIDSFREEVEVLYKNPQRNKMNIFVAEADISTREKFISKLNDILAYRERKKKELSS